ncbi:alpha/beta fold hydrolase [Idiomarina sp. X4]|uniref:alpha/beta fold hydrolase n=1 Tax=Idiomarina sp. X4 TaxID=2055892 RepID=UPI001E4ABE79|nr:alpha/beta hydrolase [Idiomarina sp. X4]
MNMMKPLAVLTLLLSSTAFPQSENPIITSQVSGEGKPVVLIPGLMSDSRVWQQAVEQLDDHYQVHQLAIAGFGDTPTRPSLRQSFTQPVLTAISQYLSESLDSKAAVIGHSLGGFLSYQLALTYPDSVSCSVAVDGVPFFSALVTMNPDMTSSNAQPQAEQVLAVYQQLSAKAMTQQASASVARQTQWQPGQALITDMAKKSDPKVVGRAMYELMITDLRPQLPKLQIPVLQMAATGAFPEAQRPMALPHYQQQVSGSEQITLLEFDNAHHFIMWDQPDAFMQATQRFLQEQCHD